MRRIPRLILVVLVLVVAGCGWNATPIKGSGPVALRLVREDQIALHWHPITVGPEVLLNEGTSISSILSGPDGRIYYGTGNPLADADVIGWLNPVNGQNTWASVPQVNPEFPLGTEPATLSQTQSAFWSQVDLVVSGAHTVWYRHWGYIGGWTTAQAFVPGVYGIPGPTITDGPWTASVRSTFSGAQSLRIMDVATKSISIFPLPSNQPPIDIAFGDNAKILWLATSSELWQFSVKRGTWLPRATLSSADFFVGMGHSTMGTWVVDANGNIGLIDLQGGIRWIANLTVSPLVAIAGPDNGLWIASRHHLTLWRPGLAVQEWNWPKSVYPSPASHWPTQTLNAPPDWPPLPHLAAGPDGSLDIGYGTWIGQAQLHTVLIMKKVYTDGGKAS
ncbi:MAG: hypothetical protein ACYCOU_14965 [Sulfobacillus sp.]